MYVVPKFVEMLAELLRAKTAMLRIAMVQQEKLFFWN